ncbi:uncharacterized protein LOC144949873 [Lampetra fluviatilis]
MQSSPSSATEHTASSIAHCSLKAGARGAAESLLREKKRERQQRVITDAVEMEDINKMWNMLEESERRVVVQVKNNSKYKLESPLTFMKTGRAEHVPQLAVECGKQILFGFCKSKVQLMGCHGLLGLRFSGTDEYVVLMFRNPLYYMPRKYAVSVENFEGLPHIGQITFNEMTRPRSHLSDNYATNYAGTVSKIRCETLGVSVTVSMTDSVDSIAYVTVDNI